jgi:hypothetical protein
MVAYTRISRVEVSGLETRPEAVYGNGVLWYAQGCPLILYPCELQPWMD